MDTPDYHHPVRLPPVIISEADREKLYAVATSVVAWRRLPQTYYGRSIERQ